jgi:predicted nucleic acid-binding protein
MVVVADTSPINYLVLIGELEVLPRTFGVITIPDSVFEELLQPAAPSECQSWKLGRPNWLEIRTPTRAPDPLLEYLGRGERDAIALSIELGAEQLLMDDKQSRIEARKRRLPVIGTVAILESASKLGLLNLKNALTRLRGTNFRISEEIMARVLADNS